MSDQKLPAAARHLSPTPLPSEGEPASPSPHCPTLHPQHVYTGGVCPMLLYCCCSCVNIHCCCFFFLGLRLSVGVTASPPAGSLQRVSLLVFKASRTRGGGRGTIEEGFSLPPSSQLSPEEANRSSSHCEHECTAVYSCLQMLHLPLPTFSVLFGKSVCFSSPPHPLHIKWCCMCM